MSEKDRGVLLLLKFAFVAFQLIANDAGLWANAATPSLDHLCDARYKGERVELIENARRERCIQKRNLVLPELKRTEFSGQKPFAYVQGGTICQSD